jgi:hypothetical protein
MEQVPERAVFLAFESAAVFCCGVEKLGLRVVKKVSMAALSRQLPLLDENVQLPGEARIGRFRQQMALAETSETAACELRHDNPCRRWSRPKSPVHNRFRLPVVVARNTASG